MDSFVDAQKVMLNWARALQGLTLSRIELSAEDFDEDSYARVYSDNPFFLTFFYVVKLYLCVLFEEHEKAYENARNARQVAHTLGGTIWPVLLDFLYGLTLAGMYHDEGNAERAGWEEELRGLAESFAVLSENCPENFRCQSLLLSSELERVRGHELKAMDLYQEAISYARETQSLPNEALANELYARFWLSRKSDEIASLYLLRARRLYQEWGAAAKVQAIDERYRSLLRGNLAEREQSSFQGMPAAPETERDLEPSSLDLSTVAKAAHAIAVEIVLEDLLRKLMKIALENAGAQRGL